MFRKEIIKEKIIFQDDKILNLQDSELITLMETLTILEPSVRFEIATNVEDEKISDTYNGYVLTISVINKILEGRQQEEEQREIDAQEKHMQNIEDKFNTQKNIKGFGEVLDKLKGNRK